MVISYDLWCWNSKLKCSFWRWEPRLSYSEIYSGLLFDLTFLLLLESMTPTFPTINTERNCNYYSFINTKVSAELPQGFIRATVIPLKLQRACSMLRCLFVYLFLTNSSLLLSFWMLLSFTSDQTDFLKENGHAFFFFFFLFWLQGYIKMSMFDFFEKIYISLPSLVLEFKQNLFWFFLQSLLKKPWQFSLSKKDYLLKLFTV